MRCVTLPHPCLVALSFCVFMLCCLWGVWGGVVLSSTAAGGGADGNTQQQQSTTTTPPPKKKKKTMAPTPRCAAALARRAKVFHPIHAMYYTQPLMLVRGDMQHLYDEQGTRYLDCFGGVTTVSVGHSHPEVGRRVSEQCGVLNHTSSLYLTEPVLDFCQRFSELLPGGRPADGGTPHPDDWVVHVVNSGSEANDFALLQARVATSNYMYMALRGGYHGFTEGSRGLVSLPAWRHPVPPPPGYLKLPLPSTHHGPMGTTPADLPRYVADMEEAILSECGGAVAGFVADYIQGIGGVTELIPGYLQEAYRLTRKYGGICVSDEVQCGFGRLGTHYWGFEAAGVDPDVVVTAKSVANGFPVGVVASRRWLADQMKGKGLYFNTFGGNAVCCAAATATIDVIEAEGYQRNAQEVGGVMKAGMQRLAGKYSCIGDVRGSGLLLGFELVGTDGAGGKEALSPAALAVRVMDVLKDDHRILVGKGGPGGNVVRMAPPMCLTRADGEEFVGALEATLAKVA